MAKGETITVRELYGILNALIFEWCISGGYFANIDDGNYSRGRDMKAVGRDEIARDLVNIFPDHLKYIGG